MIKVIEYTHAIDFMYDTVICGHPMPQEISDFYDWLVESGKGAELNAYVNHEFPNGIEKDEFFDLIVGEWKKIAEKLGYFQK